MGIKIGFNSTELNKFKQDFTDVKNKIKELKEKQIKVNVNVNKSEAIKGLDKINQQIDTINMKPLKIQVDDNGLNKLKDVTKEVEKIREALRGVDFTKLNIPDDVLKQKEELEYQTLPRENDSRSMFGDDMANFQIEKRIEAIKAQLGKDAIVNVLYNEEKDINRAVLSYKDAVGNSIKEVMKWKKNEHGKLEFMDSNIQYGMNQSKAVKILENYKKDIDKLTKEINDSGAGINNNALKQKIEEFNAIKNSMEDKIKTLNSGDKIEQTLLTKNTKSEFDEDINQLKSTVEKYKEIKNELIKEKNSIKNEFLYFNRELLKSSLYSQGSDKQDLIDVNDKYIEQYKKRIKELQKAYKSKFGISPEKEFKHELKNDEMAIRKNYELARAEHDITIKLHEQSQAHADIIRLVKERAKLQNSLKNDKKDDVVLKEYESRINELSKQLQNKMNIFSKSGGDVSGIKQEISEVETRINAEKNLQQVETERLVRQKQLYNELKAYKKEMASNEGKINSDKTGDNEKSVLSERNNQLNKMASNIEKVLRAEKLVNEEFQQGINKEVQAIQYQNELTLSKERDRQVQAQTTQLYNKYAQLIIEIEKKELDITKAHLRKQHELEKELRLEKEKLQLKKQEMESKHDFSNFKNSDAEVNAQKRVLELQQKIKQEIAKTNDLRGESSRLAASLGQKIQSSVAQFVKYKVLWEGFNRAIREAQEGIGHINEINKKQTEIRMVTGMDKQQVEELTTGYTGLAKQLAATTKEVMDGSVEFFRAGKNVQETNELVQSSIVASKLAGIDSAKATDYLIAGLNGYKKEASEAMSVVDKLTTIDNNASTSFAEMAEALKHSASSANSAGVSMDKLLSWIGVVSSVTRRNASSIGESFKTIFARIQDIKDGAVDIEDKVNLNMVESILGRIGISLRKNAKEFKPFGEVLDQVAKKWKSLDEVRKAEVIKAMAGTRQREMFIALMENYTQSLELEKQSLNSAGQAQERYGLYLESTEAKLNQLKVAREELWGNLMNSNMIQSVIQDLTGLLHLLSSMVTETPKASIALIGLSTTFLLLISHAKGVVAAINAIKGAIIAYRTAAAVGATATQGLTAALSALGVVSLGSVGIFLLIAAAIGGCGYAIYRYIKHQSDLKKQTDELRQSQEKLKESIDKNNLSNSQSNMEQQIAQQNKLKKLIEERKNLQEQLNNIKNSDMDSFSKDRGASMVQDRLSAKTKEIDDFVSSLEKAGLTVNKFTGDIKELANAQEDINVMKNAEAIRQTTQAEIENRKEITALINQYFKLSSIQNKNVDVRAALANTVNKLNGHIKGLIVTQDKEGVTIIKNTDLLRKECDMLNVEGTTVENLINTKLNAAKQDATIQVGTTRMTYREITKRIDMYKAEAAALNQAKSQSGRTYDQLESMWKAGTLAKGSQDDIDFQDMQRGMLYHTDVIARKTMYLEEAKRKLDDIYKISGGSNLPSGITHSSNFTPPYGDDYKAAKGKTKKPKQERKVEDLKLEIDRYKYLKMVLQDVQNQIDSIKDAEDLMYNERKLKYMDREIVLLNQKTEKYKLLIKEQQKERAELKNSLYGAGVKFDARGNITNYKAVLLAKQAAANKLSGEVKESAKKRVQEFKKDIDKYLNLTFKDMPEAEKSIRKITKTKAEMEKDRWEIQIKVYDENIDKLKDKLEDAKYKLNMLNIIDKDNNEEKIKLIKEIIAQSKIQRDYYRNIIDDLTIQQKKMKDHSMEWVVVNEAIKKYKQNMRSIAIDMGNYIQKLKDVKKNMEDYITKVEDKVVAVIKKVYEKKQEADKEFHKQSVDRENERHKNALKNIELEKEKRLENIDLKLKELEQEKEKHAWDEKLNKLQRDKNKLQEKYNSLTMVSSPQGAYLRHELKEKMEKLDEKIEEEKYQHKVKLAKKDLEEQKKKAEKEVKEKKKTEDEKYEAKKKELDKELKDIDKHYKELLEKDNLYTKARQAIMDGMVKDINGKMVSITDMLKKYMDKYDKGLSILGDKIKTELLDNLAKVQDILKNNKLEQLTEKEKQLNKEFKDAKNSDKQSLIDEVKKENPTRIYAMSNNRSVNDYTNAKGVFSGKQVVDVGRMTQGERDSIQFTPNDVIIGVAGNYFSNNPSQFVARKVAAGKDTNATKDNMKKYLSQHSYSNGGIITENQIAALHGSESDWEAVLTKKHLAALMEKTIKTTLNSINTMGRVDNMKVNAAPPIVIDKLMNIEGNVTEETVPYIQQAGNDAVDSLKSLYNRMNSIGRI